MKTSPDAPTAVADTRPLPGRERLDVSILVVATALVVIGLLFTLSASAPISTTSTGSAFTLFLRHALWAVIGVACLALMWRFDYRKLAGWSYGMVPVIWLLLIATLIPGIGTTAGGATRWLPLGPLSFQPSEAAKLVLIVFGADVLGRKIGKLDDWRHVVVPYLGAAGLTSLLVLMQPDFGTMVILAVSCLMMTFLAGAALRFLGTIVVLGVVIGFPVMLAEGYRRARFFGFLNPEGDPLNTGFQSLQGLVALGDGGLIGNGLGASRAKQGFLPNPHTDFIFAIIGEETGLAGTLVVLALFGVLAVLGVRAARRATDAFGFLIASGATAGLMLQALINIGAVSGVLPITGVPLPLLSFGGSSLLFSLAAIGLVASVARRGRSPAGRKSGRRTAAATGA